MAEPMMGDRTAATTAGNGASHHIACLFSTRASAEQAVDALIRAGISRSAINVVDQASSGVSGASASTGTTASGQPETGFWDSLKRMFTGDDTDVEHYYEGVSRGQTLVNVRTRNEAEADHAASILEQYEPVDLDSQESSWRGEGWQGNRLAQTSAGTSSSMASSAKPGATTAATSASSMAARATSGTAAAMTGRAGEEEVIPVTREDIAIAKRDRARGSVRVRAYTITTPVEEDVRLREERVHIERRPVDRSISDVGAETFRDRTIEMTETSEEAVVAKNARVTEEVVIRKDVGERVEHVSDNVRRTEVEVEDGRTATGKTSGTPTDTGMGRTSTTGAGTATGPTAPGQRRPGV